ncbi:hypothetical protein [Parafilimonas sp.]|uniref:hypothetical protein n=1 Tax=Parafilimonas sp. TaxID=1969739 RepID=UPI0039E49187
MSKQNNQYKKDLAKFLIRNAEQDSRDEQAAKDFLLSEDFNVDKLIIDGLKRIKKMQLLINARSTELEMEETTQAKSEAIAWVDDLLNKQNFSIVELVRTEELSLSFRNLDSMNETDVRDILIRHFTLKFMNKGKRDE